jgi:DNA-binding beta-propeller fold protein YncE
LTAAGATLAASLPDLASARTAGGTPLGLVTADQQSHVVAIDLSSGAVVRRVRTLPGPRSIEAASMTWAVVAHTTSGRLSIIHAPTLRVRHVVEGFRQPRYTAVLPFDTTDPVWRASEWPTAFVTDSEAREVVAVDVRRGRIVGRTPVPGPARHVSLSPDGQTLWTALGSKAEHIAVLDIDEKRGPRFARTITAPAAAHDVVFAPDGRHVWVTSGDGRRLWVYEVDSRKPVAELAADEPPQHIAWVGGRAFVASGDSGTMRIHRADGELVDEVAVPVGSYNVTFDWQRAVTPSLERGTVALLDAKGRVRSVQRVAHAAHDACVVVGL